MARYEYGHYIAKTATLRFGTTAFIRDADGRILLTRRTDNGLWCMPGGMVDVGESVEESCAREVLEETGLTSKVGRLIGVYSTPHRVTVYNDGNRVQYISITFEVEITGGALGLSDETTEAGYFTVEEIAGMDLVESHVERIADALAGQTAAFVK